MKKPIDNFSTQSGAYKKFRPTYPKELYDFLFSQCSNFESAWDCATGNGQVAAVLADKFKSVYASDISQQQLEWAISKDNIQYSIQRAEKTHFPDDSFDLITVAQAIHWFDMKAFSGEVNRVLKPNGLVAVWGYGLGRISSEIDEKADHFYHEIVGDYWNFERRHIEEQYENLTLGLKYIKSNHEFYIDTFWNINQFEGFFNSWSAVQNYIKANKGINPVPNLVEDVKGFWQGEEMKVSFPLFLKLYSK